jgi:hypothetical protein
MSEFDDEWLSESPMDSPIGGGRNDRGENTDESGLRLATNSPLYKGPASLQSSKQADKDPYTIAVEGYDDDPESPREEVKGKGKNASGQKNVEVSAMQSKRRRRNIMIGSACIILVLICIIVGVVVSNNNKDNDGASEEPATNPNTTNSTGSSNNTSTSGVNATIVDTEDAFVLPYQGDREGIVLYTTNVGPFQVEIPTLASDAKFNSVYDDESQFRDGLSRSALFLMNNVAGRVLGWPGFENAGYGSGGFSLGVGCGSPLTCAPVSDNDIEEEIEADSPSENIDSFKTNNQEESLDEADVAKSDGTFIYAAYGSSLLIFSASSKKVVLKLPMPLAQCQNITEDLDVVDGYSGNETEVPGNSSEVDFEQLQEEILPYPGPDYSCPQPNIEAILLNTNHSTLALVVSGYGNELRERAATETPVFLDFLSTQIRLYSTKPLINMGAGITLLAKQDISGFYQQGYVMEESGIAHLVTTSTVNTQDWLVAPTEALQNQKAVRNSTADDNEDEFLKMMRNSRSEIIDAFINQTVFELSAMTGDLPRMAPLRLPIVNASGVDGLENILLGSGYGNEVVHIASFDMRGEITLEENSTEGVIPVSETIQFVESSWGEVYAAESMLVKTSTAYNFNGEVEEDMTVLYAYSLENMTTTPFATGMVPGLLLNRYALDYHDGLFRAATTTRAWETDVFFIDDVTEEVGIRFLQENITGNFVFLEACPSVESIATDNCFTADILSDCTNMTERACSSIFYYDQGCPLEIYCLDDLQESQCPLPNATGDTACLNGENIAKCIALELQGCETIETAESCPLQFFCGDGPSDESPDNVPTVLSTKNQIFVLERPSEAIPEMMIVGNVTMGKPGEAFTAVRFFDNIAYAVTYLQTDPFYVISFEESRTPVVLGELEVSGFSSYMHSIDANNTQILTVGTETKPDGQEIGLKLSLFNATNRTNPTEVAKLVFSENSWSTAAWDFQAFRYVPLSEEEASIIIPVFFHDPDSDESFDGFVVFGLSDGVLSESFRISHEASNNIFLEQDGIVGSCYDCGYLQPRSFVIQGNVTTLKGQSVRSHNLETGDPLWSRDFIGEESCCS